MNHYLSKIAKAFGQEIDNPLPAPARSLPACSAENLDPPQRSVLVLDSSGSMSLEDYQPCRLHAAQSSAREFVRQRAARSPSDEIAIVAFGTRAHCKCKLQSAINQESIAKAIDSISPSGYTAMGRGLREAEKMFGRTPTRGPLAGIWKWLNEAAVSPQAKTFRNRVILLTDGHHCHGGHPLPVAKRLKRVGVQIDCVGIGGDRAAVDEQLLQTIASIDDSTGRPRYRFIKDSGALQAHFRQLATGITR